MNSKIKTLLTILLFILIISISFQSGYAVPVPAIVEEYLQPDGTKFSGRAFGDEWYSWFETADGYTILLDEKDGWWKFAMQDAQGFLKPGPFRVGIDDPTKLGLLKKIQPTKEVIQSIRQQKYLGKGIPSIKEIEPTTFPEHLIEPEPGRPPVQEVTPKGNVKNLVILCRFSDHDTTKYFPAIMYDSVFNTVGYNYDGAVGSVRDYYVENSYGQLTILSTIAGNTWVNLPKTEAYYGTDGASRDTAVKEMIIHALDSVDSYVDFSQFDTDGDGYVDCITFIHSGYGQEYAAASTTWIWSKKWSLDSPYITAEGVRVSHFHTEPALRGISGKSIGRIGVICHEMGHFFGLPDLYDTDGSTGGQGEGAGVWCLMASGSWGYDGGSEPQRPTHFSAWSKTQLGWLNPTILHSKSGQSLIRVETDKSIGKIIEGFPTSQYYLVENRQRYGFDSNLLGGTNGGGLCVWHVDESQRNNNTRYNYKVGLIEADGNWSLHLASSRGQNGDPYPGSSNNTTLSPYSTPSTYSNPIGAGTTSYITFSNIPVSQMTMQFNLATLVPTLNNPSDNTTGSYTVSWSTSVNATQYMLAEGRATTVYSYSDGAEDETQSRDDWTKLGEFKRTNQNASAGSYSYVARWCDDPASSGGWTLWNSDYQFLSLNQPFLVTATTQVTFKTRYYLYSSTVPWQRAYFQIRRATEDTWNTISTFRGDVTSSWASVTISSSLFSGFSGSTCYVRFAAINLAGPVYSYYTTTPNWPWNGFAFDEFAINNAVFATFSWSTVDNAIPSSSTSTTFTGKAVGTYAYKVAGYANSAWQNWSNIEDVTVSFSTITAVGGGPIGLSSEWEATGFNNGRRLVRDSNGYFHAFWHTQWPITATSGANCQIFYSYTTVTAIEPPAMAAQGKWATPINLTSGLGFYDNRYPSVAIAYDTATGAWQTTNVLHIVWQAITASPYFGGRYEVYYGKITVNRPPTAPAPWVLAQVMNLSNTTTDSLVPAIAINRHTGVANQHIHVVWQEEDYNNGGVLAPPAEDTWFSDILYRRSTTSGTTWTAKINLSNSAMNSQMPSIACILEQYSGASPGIATRSDYGYNSDDVHVSYNEDFGPGMIHVYYLRSLNDGVTWNPKIDVSASIGASTADAYSNIAVDMCDNPHITFMRYNITQMEPLRTGAPALQYLPGINPLSSNSFPGPDIGMYGSKPNVIVYAYSTTTGTNWYWLDFLSSNDREFPTVGLDRWQHVNVNWQEYQSASLIPDYEIMRVTRLNTYIPSYPLLQPKYAGTWSTVTSDSYDPHNDDLFPNFADRKVAQYLSLTEPSLAGYDEVWTKLTGRGEMAATSAPKFIYQDGNMSYDILVPVELSRFDAQ